ncbi:hypothetical protein TKK_0018770 [Trichogramma kaykai]|uniref:EB domain-containing protein n=1 Tax=Trichogramma kaykai TaxID=54128 RepID=A0ABD2VWH9_9HYME
MIQRAMKRVSFILPFLILTLNEEIDKRTARIGKVENCTKTEDCQRVKMGVCKSGLCECPDTHAMSTDRKSCLPKVRNLDDECTESVQCESLGSALCAHSRCRCEPEHHYTVSGKRCIPNKDNELDSADSGNWSVRLIIKKIHNTYEKV